MTAAHGSILILLIAVFFYITELVPIAVTAMGSCVLLALFGLAGPATVWSGLSSDTTLFVGGMIAIITAVIETGATKSLCSWLIRKTAGKVYLTAILIVLLATVISGFMNNSAAVAITLPVMAGVVAVSDGKLYEKHWFMPLAVGTNAGGMLTAIGTTSQMVVQNALQEQHLPLFGFFEFAWVGVPMCILFFTYFLIMGKWLNQKIWPNVSEPTQFVKDIMSGNQEEQAAESPAKKRKQLISIAILVGTIVCVMTADRISNGTFAMIGTLLVIVTGCISLEDMYRKFDWTTMFVLAGGIGFAAGLDQSGGGRLIAETIAGFFGSSLTPMHIFTMLVLTGASLTIFMSNTAVAAMLLPVALAFTQILDFNLRPVLMGICMATNCAFLTPLATPSMTMVLGPGEYKFMDYVKYCIIFNIFAVALLFVVIPRVWPL